MHPKNHITIQFPGDLMEYMWMHPKGTGLNVDVFVDDGGAYIRHNEPLLLWVRNGYDKSVGEFIPVSVSLEPQILNDTIPIRIAEIDIQAVSKFIVSKLNLLQALADRKISQIDFFHLVKETLANAVHICGETNKLHI